MLDDAIGSFLQRGKANNRTRALGLTLSGVSSSLSLEQIVIDIVHARTTSADFFIQREHLQII